VNSNLPSDSAISYINPFAPLQHPEQHIPYLIMSEQLHSYPPRLSLDHGVITYPTFTTPPRALIRPAKTGPSFVRRSYHAGDPIWLLHDGDPYYTPYLFDGYRGGTMYNEEGKRARRIAFITSEEFRPTQKIMLLGTILLALSRRHAL
jgi:hypothetical protein